MRFHPAGENDAQPSHLCQLFARHVGRRRVAADLIKFGHEIGVVVTDLAGVAEYLRKVDRCDTDAMPLKNLLDTLEKRLNT